MAIRIMSASLPRVRLIPGCRMGRAPTTPGSIRHARPDESSSPARAVSTQPSGSARVEWDTQSVRYLRQRQCPLEFLDSGFRDLRPPETQCTEVVQSLEEGNASVGDLGV